MNLLFYDIEVFQEDVILVFKRLDKSVHMIFHNEFDKLADLVNKHVLVGYNNYHYDDKILSKILDGAPTSQIKNTNDAIIAGEDTTKVKAMINSLDCFQQIDVSRPGLKKIEGNMGKAIVESVIPFDLGRKLTEDELQEVIEYCCYDVDSTIDVYSAREGYFTTKQMLMDMLGKQTAQRWNTTTMSANILLKKPIVKWSNLRVPEDFFELVDESVKDLWFKKEKGSITVEEFENSITFGFGGLHGEHLHKKRVKNVRLLDVTSMYPNIIIALRALGPATDVYQGMLEERVRIKHADKVRSDALKLVLNSVYGNLNNKYSLLYNPKATRSVCVYGQIALYELCKMIAPYVTIININTDGVAFVAEDERYQALIPEWEEQFKLKLEEDRYDEFIQKDVNNYIAVNDGKVVKAIGGDVKRYFKEALFTNNNARIIDIAMVDKLVHGKDVLETLTKHLDEPHLYQYILKAGGTYQGTVDGNRVQQNNVNRVFASKTGDFCLYKHRADGGLVQFADAPSNMYLWNQDVKEFDSFRDIVDLNHYYKIIVKKLERWIC